MKVNKTLYGWEFVNMTKVEVDTIKKLLDGGIFELMYQNIAFDTNAPNSYKVKFERKKI